jgi:hypothetical protein
MTPEYRNDLLELYQQQDIDSQDDGEYRQEIIELYQQQDIDSQDIDSQDEGEYRDEIICDNERYDAMELDY